MDKTKIAVDVFNKHASSYQEKFMDVSLYHDSLDLFCNAIEKKVAEILELACGPGNITKYLLNRRSDFKLLGTDLSPNMLALAKINNPGAKFQLMDCRNFGASEKRYDAIVCGFCLPYLTKEEAINLITNALKILNPKGVLYISTMEDDYSKSGFKKGSAGDEIFLHYHQADYLKAALEENHFKILDLQRIESVMADGTKVTDLILIAGK